MINRAMADKIRTREAIDVSGCARDGKFYILREFVEDVDYCDAASEIWIWSVGRRPDGTILASTGTEFYQNPDYECLFLR